MSARSATCGDGVLDPDEQCDDGAACADGRSCTDDRYRCDGIARASCQPRGGDGCSASCTLEPDAVCSGGASSSGGCGSGETPMPALPHDDTGEETQSPIAAAPDASGDDAGGDGPLDESDTASEPPACNLGAFGAPAPIAGLDRSLSLWAPGLSADGQTVYFAASPDSAVEALFSAKRVSRSRVSEPTRLVALESGDGEGTPFPSFDGLTLYFYSERDADGDRDLWLGTRADVASEFGDPRALFGINTTALDHLPWLSADELTMLFVSSRQGGLGQADIWIATRQKPDVSFFNERPLDGVNTERDEGRAVMSRDGLTLFFTSTRDGGQGAHDIWTATRADRDAAFGPPENVSALNSAGGDVDPFLSANERELWFSSDRDGSVGLWRAVRDCAD